MAMVASPFISVLQNIILLFDRIYGDIMLFFAFCFCLGDRQGVWWNECSEVREPICMYFQKITLKNSQWKYNWSSVFLTQFLCSYPGKFPTLKKNQSKETGLCSHMNYFPISNKL